MPLAGAVWEMKKKRKIEHWSWDFCCQVKEMEDKYTEEKTEENVQMSTLISKLICY